MKKVFVILLNWNNWHETRNCLASLEKLNYRNLEVLVVDNGSSPEDVSRIKNFNTKYYILNTIYSDSNLGFAGGCNVGIKYALEHGADYVFLLNNDTVVAPDFLTKLMEAAESDSSFGILGSRIYKLKENGEKADEIVFCGGKANAWLNRAEHLKCELSMPENPKYPPSLRGSYGGAGLPTGQAGKILNTKYSYITGAAFLIKREVIEKIGLMREEYFLYYEDVDWCVRAKRAGFKCVLVPESKIWHKVSATNKEGSPSYIYYHTRNRLMLAKFNGNILQRGYAYLLGMWILLKQIPKFFMGKEKKIWARSMTRGVFDFYRGKYGKY